jgi:hypothetical protein
VEGLTTKITKITQRINASAFAWLPCDLVGRNYC